MSRIPSREEALFADALDRTAISKSLQSEIAK
jgi:hypothetical protein